MIRTTSSYEQNEYGDVFADITKTINPSHIVEIGIGNGYSLKSFVENTNCKITAVDLFDDFPFNRADEDTIRKMFIYNLNVEISKGNFYSYYTNLVDDSVDIIHIDVANNGDVYQFAVENYMPKLRQGGVMILEGGSDERDNVEWMVKYHKRKIRPYLESLTGLNICVLEDFPSLTIIKK